MQYVTREDGVRIAYEIHNSGGPGTPLLLTHGYSATSAMWGPNIDALSKDRPVLTYDQRGHGRSGAPDDPRAYSEEASVADVDALIDVLRAPKVVVAGMSLGGYLSLAYYLAHPQRVAALVLQDTGPGYKSDKARTAWNDHVAELAAKTQVEGHGRARSPEVAAAVHEHPEALVLVARGVLTQRDDRVISSLPTIAVPTLVIVGADDTNYLAGTDYMADHIPGARKHVIPDAGHAANIDQPDVFNNVVAEFLNAL